MTPHYADESVTLWLGDTLDVLRTLPAGSVDCCVTSPPYYGLRDYGEPGQYGLEPSPAEYVETMRAVFAEVRRVLADDGTLWLNLGDSYASTTTNNGGYSAKSGLRDGKLYPNEKGRAANDSAIPRQLVPSVPAKNLLGMPWRVAFALQADGWILRNAIIWDKPNAMPESVRDRLSTTYELVFMFAKRPRYWFNLDAVREPHIAPAVGGLFKRDASSYVARASGPQGKWDGKYSEAGKNPGDVWSIPTQPFAAAHFAVMASDLAERCILAGCKPGGTVLDSFCGSGTTGMVAQQHGRRFVGIDLNREYLDLALRTRLAQTAIVDEASA